MSEGVRTSTASTIFSKMIWQLFQSKFNQERCCKRKQNPGSNLKKSKQRMAQIVQKSIKKPKDQLKSPKIN
jgi:hypothetical protein